MRVVIISSLACLALTGCLARESVASVPQLVQACPAVLVQKGPTPPQCVQIQGSDVGRLPLELRLGDRAIHLAEWTQADESSSAVIGFAAHLPSDVVYAVKAGENYYAGREPRWLHPEGITGPRVHRIEAVTFCRVLPTRCGTTPIMVDASSAGLGVVASRQCTCRR